MGKLDYKLDNLGKGIVSLERAVTGLGDAGQLSGEFIQDSVLLRFETLIPLACKAVACALEGQDFADVPASPQDIADFAQGAGFLSPTEHNELVKYIALHDVAWNIYDSQQSALIVAATPDALALIKTLFVRMKEQR